MRYFWLGLVGVGSGCLLLLILRGSPAKVPGLFGGKPAIEIVVTGPEGPIPAGTADPLRASIKNNGRRAFTVLRPGGATLRGHHIAPPFEWRVTRDGQPVPFRDYEGRCGTVAPLMPEDFLTVEPGRSVDPHFPLPTGHKYGFDLLRPGTYEITLVYRFDPNVPDDLGYDVRPGVPALVEQAFVGQCASKPFTLTVGPMPPQLAAALERVREAEARAAEARRELDEWLTRRGPADPWPKEMMDANQRLSDTRAELARLETEFERLRLELSPKGGR